MNNTKDSSLSDNQIIFNSFTERLILTFREKLINLLNTYKIENVSNILEENIQFVHQNIYLISVRTLIYEINIWKQERGDLIIEMSPNEKYLAYCEQFKDENYYTNFCNKYPVLIKKINRYISNTLSFLEEVLLNLNRDSKELYFKFEFNTNNIKSISFIGEGDSHNHGKKTMMLDDGNKKIIYKPHSLGNDIFLSEVFNLLDGLIALDLKVPLTIDKNNYGWQEYLETSNTKKGINNYFYRYGELICVAHVLTMTDLHKENLIRVGEYPILIDTETVITNNSYNFNSKSINLFNVENPQNLLNKEVSKSVINTLLLPNNTLGGLYDVDLSPLAGSVKQSSEILTGFTINNEYTDNICFEKKYYQQEKSEEINACKYLSYILDGFTDCYNVFLENKDYLKSKIFETMKKSKLVIRQVLRPTYIYYKFYDASNHPDYLKTKEKQKGLIEKLKSKKFSEDIRLCQQADIEITSLLGGDIPYFYERAYSNDLCSVYGIIKNFYKKNIFEIVEEKIDSICKDDLIRQQRMIRLSMSTLLDSNWNHEDRGNVNDIKRYFSYFQGSKEEIQANVGNYFCHEAIWNTDKTWCIWPSHSLLSERLKISTLNYYLYDGGGTLIWLNFLAAETGDERYRDVAKAGLEGFLKIETPKLLSAFNGIGSLLYIYYSLYKIWDDERYYTKYTEVLTEISKIKLKEGLPIDYCNGISGMVVLFINLYLIEKNPVLFNLAIKYGDYCIKNISQINLTGLAHGYAGISLAIAGCYYITMEEKYLNVVEQLIEAENMYYDEEKNNWRDLRNHSEDGDPVYWCHGASGIGVSRMKLYQYTKNENYKVDLERCIKKMEKSMFELKDHSLCHGMFGNLDCLISIAELLPESIEGMNKTIEEIYLLICEDIKKNGVVCGISNAYDMFSFMVGIPGMTYAMMRKKNRSYPSILLLEVIE